MDILERVEQVRQGAKADEEQAVQVFDGVMLGDAGLVRREDSVYFSMDLSAGDPSLWCNTTWSGRDSKIPQIQYLYYIKDCLEFLGIESCKGHPRAQVYSGGGKPYLHCYIESHASSFLLTKHECWYRSITAEVRKLRWFRLNQRWYKVLPDSLTLSPLTVAVWFGDDGSTSWKPYPRVALTISTNNFAREEVDKLKELLSLFGIQVGVSRSPKVRKTTWELRTSAVDNVNAFFDLVENYIHPCYNYKIKRAAYR